MGGRSDIRGDIRPLPQHRKIDAERLAQATQLAFDLAVHLAKAQVAETRGEVCDQCLELETLLEVLGRGPRVIDRGGHVAESYRLRDAARRRVKKRGPLVPRITSARKA
jgi:hypothetical protein